MGANGDRRKNTRYKANAVIWHDNLLPGVFYSAKLANLSNGGLYFESDQILYQGEEICLGTRKPPASDADGQKYVRVEIKWRKDLDNASYSYGYGAQYVDPDNIFSKSLDSARRQFKLPPANDSPAAKDPRKHPRGVLHKKIHFSSGKLKYSGFITDISRGGAFIETRDKFSPGQMVELVLPGDALHEDLPLKAWVVRLNPKGIGLKFDRRIGRNRRAGLDRRRGKKKRA